MHRVVDMGREACRELFESYGVSIAHTSEPLSERFGCCGVIGFTSDNLRGSIIIAASNEILQRSYPIPGAPPQCDWLGELANQMLGRLKHKLLSHGVEIALATPIVLQGYEIQPLFGGAHFCEHFSSGAGAVRLWLDLDAEPGFALCEEMATSNAAEGDLLLF